MKRLRTKTAVSPFAMRKPLWRRNCYFYTWIYWDSKEWGKARGKEEAGVDGETSKVQIYFPKHNAPKSPAMLILSMP